METMITFCVLIFHLGHVASSPFAYPEEYNIAYGTPQAQYQHYQTFAQPQPLYGQRLQYDNAARSSAQAFVGNTYNNGYPNTQQLPTTVPNTAFVNAERRQSYQNVLRPASPPAQQIQEQIAAEIEKQQAIKKLANEIRTQTAPVRQPISFVAEPYLNNLPSANQLRPAPQWTQAVATAGVQQQRTAPSPETVNPYAQIYQHVVQRPKQNYDSQFLDSLKQRLQTPEPSQKKPYLVIYPDGRTEYVDKIDTVKENYPNYVLVNAGQSPTTTASQTKASGLAQQSVLPVPLQQQRQTGSSPPQISQQPDPHIPRQPSQTAQHTQLNNPQPGSQPQPTITQPNSQSPSSGVTGQQSQPKSSPRSNSALQNPLESLYLNSTSTKPVSQPAPVPEKPQPTILQRNSQSPSSGATGQQSKPKSGPPSNSALQNPLESLLLNSTSTKPESQPAPVPEEPSETSVISSENVNPPQSPEKITNDAQSESQLLNASANPSAPQNSSSDSQPDSPANQPKSSNSNPGNEPSNSVNQAKLQTDDPNKETQPQSSLPEEQSQTVNPEDQPEPQSFDSEDQSQPQKSIQNDQLQPQLSQDDEQQYQPSKIPDHSESEFHSPDNQVQPQSNNLKDQAQPNSSDYEAQPPNSSNQPQPSNPSDQTTDKKEPLTANSDDDQQSQPADTSQSQPTEPTQDKEPQSSDNQPKPLENQDEAIPEDFDLPNATSESTTSDNCPDNKQITSQHEPSQGPGKIVIIDNTGLQSKDLTEIDSEILSNLFGDSPYAVVQFFLVKPERTVQRNATRMHFGDHHILEEITESDQYGDAEPVVTSETHLIKLPQSQ